MKKKKKKKRPFGWWTKNILLRYLRRRDPRRKLLFEFRECWSMECAAFILVVCAFPTRRRGLFSGQCPAGELAAGVFLRPSALLQPPPIRKGRRRWLLYLARLVLGRAGLLWSLLSVSMVKLSAPTLCRSIDNICLCMLLRKWEENENETGTVL